MAKPKAQRSTGIMNKMRDKMPIIIIFLIVAFLGTIIFEWGMNYLGLRGGGENVKFGSVNGVEISPKDFQTEVNRRIENQKQQNKKELDENAVQQLRDQVWNEYVNKIILDDECRKLGVSVTDDEITDWVYKSPETLPEALRKYFMDSTGNFRMDIYEQALKDTRPEVKDFWVAVEEYLRQTLIQSKLYSVVAGAVNISEGEVLQKYKDDNLIANFDYIFLDPNTLTDTTLFNVTEQDLKSYYDKNKDEFKQEEAVRFKYVLFSDSPTLDDSNFTGKDLEALIPDLKTSEEADSSLIALVNDNSQTPYNSGFQKPNTIAKGVLNFLFSSKPNDVSKLIIDQDGYHIAKLLDSKEGEDTYVNAEHILVNFGTDTAAAKKKAEDILKRVKGKENFEDVASEISDDPSAKQNRGDLGWFTKGAMVKEFEEACLKANPGDIVGPVKTNFGFHIIKVKGKNKKEFKFADIKKSVTASSTTKSIVRDKANEFYKSIEKGDNIDTLAKKYNVMAMSTPDISKDGFVPGAGQNKTIIKFGLANNIGKVERPVKVQGGYAVYLITARIKEGYKIYDSIKVAQIKPKVINEKKFERMLTNANDMKNKIQNNDLNTLLAFNPQNKIEKADSVSISKPNPSIGQDYALMNAVFNLKDGEVSAPIKGTRGYYIVKMRGISSFNQNDFAAKAQDIRKQLLSSKQQSLYQEWMTNLQSQADIVDNRDMYM
jgi:peptidyl-prolyl cis-trans isomerase D